MEAKQSEKTSISFCFAAKRKIIGHEENEKNYVLISLWLEAKNLKRKEAKFFERAKQMRNRSGFALKQKKFFVKLAHPKLLHSDKFCGPLQKYIDPSL